MTATTTADGVDCLSVYSAHVTYPKHADGSCEVIFVLKHDLLDPNIYSTAMLFPDGYVMCKSESELCISGAARKRLREITHFMAVKIVKKLRNIV